MSVDHPSRPAGVGRYTRAFQNMVIDLREVGEKRTRIRCVMRVDLGGNIPRGIFRRTVGQTALMAFKAVRAKALVGQKKEDKAGKKEENKKKKKKKKKN